MVIFKHFFFVSCPFNDFRERERERERERGEREERREKRERECTDIQTELERK